MSIRIEKWKYAKRFVYSITYDEALERLFDYAVPLHDEFRIPGHVEVVAGQVGKVRRIKRGSSFNGMRHMSARQLKYLIKKGWGIGNHSMTHGIMAANSYNEVVRSKYLLEKVAGVPVTAFAVPGSNDNYPAVVPLARKHGYLCIMTVTDGLNDHDTDLFALKRSPLIERGYAPFFREYDPYDRIMQAKEERGWIIDYTHVPLPRPISLEKNVTPGTLRRRFEKLKEVGQEDIWFANPDEVVDYMLMRKCTHIEDFSCRKNKIQYRMRVRRLPREVRARELTFTLSSLPKLKKPLIVIDEAGEIIPHTASGEGSITFTHCVKDGQTIMIVKSP